MLVAVYGTLKRNFSNHDPYMRNAVFMCNIVVPGIMFSMRHYPGVVLHEQVPLDSPQRKYVTSHRVHCEVYSITAKELESLDRLEGHPEYYLRKSYKHEHLDEVFIYTIKPHVYLKGLQAVVPSGIWQASTTTVEQVDFGNGDCKPKVLAWTGLGAKPSLPKQYEDWDDIDESESLSTFFDQLESFDTPEAAEEAEYEYTGQVINVDEDISGLKEASG